MFIDMSRGRLTLSPASGDLSAAQVSQLHFWGFAKGSDGNYLESPDSSESLLLKIVSYCERENIPFTLSQESQEYLSRLERKQIAFETMKQSARDYKEGRLDITKFKEFANCLQRSVPRKLKDHQIKAAYHLCLLGNAANFSVPGSGKTAVILTAYNKFKTEGRVNFLFVIGPPSCFSPWITEFELTLGRKPQHKILAGGSLQERKSFYYSNVSDQTELILITYQTLNNDIDSIIRFFNQRGAFPFLVIDEAHYIKQSDGQWAKAALALSKSTDYKCVLTGTPLPRSYTDIFNLFDFLYPESCPIDEDAKIRIRINEDRKNISNIRESLNQAIGPLFYRVRKCDLGLIPPVFHDPVELPMNRHEGTIYRAIESKIRDYTKNDYLSNIELINLLWRGRMMRLRQSVSNAKLLVSAIENYREELIDRHSELYDLICNYDKLEKPAKLQYLVQLATTFRKQKLKAIVWSHFVGTLKLITECLSDNGFYCKMIYGATPVEQTGMEIEETREQIRREFLDPSSGLDLLVANPAACGESISLHKTCFHAVYYDLSYNCGQYLQSLDRIHRVGGSETNQAHYHFLQYTNTIEQDIKNNLERKAQKMYEIIDEDYSIYSLDMTEEDEDFEAYKRLFLANHD